MKSKLLLPVFIVNLCFSFSFAQPSDRDYILGYGGTALFLGTEFIFKEDLTPVKARWSKPNTFDTFFRTNLKWDDADLSKAALYSDILLKGIIIPSVFLSSYKSGYKYSSYLLLQMQVLAGTGILTHAAKFIFGRERPYSYFNTNGPGFPQNNLSFFSGHSSFSYAVVTSSSYLLQKAHPAYSGLIWSSGLLLASTTAYMRVAADRHYMSDILTGMVIGSAIGYLVAKNQRKEFFELKSKPDPDFQINFALPLK
jgi:membrane-associated phospholipid phosphatase